jgi:LmbE family N-acetylglucosaminyl deacetylase
MEFQNSTAVIFIPDGLPFQQALERTTHMCVAAHQDDIEIMAINGILNCFHQPNQWFCGVVATDGSGSPRDGIYRDYLDEQMCKVRQDEQKKAALIGEYSALVMLGYASSTVKNPEDNGLTRDLQLMIRDARPDIIFTHNLADKHPTHVAVALRTIAAIRELEISKRPKHIFGCEVWRDLDWMLDDDKIVFNTTEHENLQNALLGVFDSQISGGKRYDLATMGRRRANATYYSSHSVDAIQSMVTAMDLTPLILDPNLIIQEYVQTYLQRFSDEVNQTIIDLQ